MSNRALASAAATAVLLTAVVVVAGRGEAASSAMAPTALGVSYAAQLGEPPEDDPPGSSNRRQSGTGGPVTRLPDLLAPIRDAPIVGDGQDDAGAGDAGDRARPPLDVVGNVLWDSTFDDGLDAWRYIHNEDQRVQTVQSPAREGGSAVQLTADGGGDNRAQLDGPVILEEGQEAYVGWSTYFPEDMPEVSGWSVFFQLHGEPFGESPSVAFGFSDGEISFDRGAAYGHDTPWSMPLERGRWIDFVTHVRFSKSEEDGFVELWVDGKPQQLNGAERLQTSTLWDNQNEGLFPAATAYYEGGPTVTLFHDSIRVADTYEAAAPRG